MTERAYFAVVATWGACSVIVAGAGGYVTGGNHARKAAEVEAVTTRGALAKANADFDACGEQLRRAREQVDMSSVQQFRACADARLRCEAELDRTAESAVRCAMGLPHDPVSTRSP